MLVTPSGREDKVDRVLDRYQDRIKDLKKLFGERLEKTEVSIFEFHAGNFSIQGSYVVYLQVLNDLGIRILPKLLNIDNTITLNVEVLNEYDADILFIVNADDNPRLSAYLQKPPLSLLKAVKNNRAYFVKSNIWWPYGPLGVNRLLDELPKYLLGGEPNSSKISIPNSQQKYE